VSPVCAQVFQDRGHHVVEWKGGLSVDELKAELPKYDGIVIRSATKLTAEVFPSCPNLKVSVRHTRCCAPNALGRPGPGGSRRH